MNLAYSRRVSRGVLTDNEGHSADGLVSGVAPVKPRPNRRGIGSSSRRSARGPWAVSGVKWPGVGRAVRREMKRRATSCIVANDRDRAAMSPLGSGATSQAWDNSARDYLKM
ncbi:hypothetical protein CIB48_g10490 [Xylaria polymorpha]|nr:hypothetical protein CIB48_g10490 [Xylaria polymorpha]